MRGLLKFLLYAALAVALVWSGTVAYHRISESAGTNQAATGGAMRSAIWVP